MIQDVKQIKSPQEYKLIKFFAIPNINICTIYITHKDSNTERKDEQSIVF